MMIMVCFSSYKLVNLIISVEMLPLTVIGTVTSSHPSGGVKQL